MLIVEDRPLEQKGYRGDIHSVIHRAILTKCFFQSLQSLTQQMVRVSQDGLREVFGAGRLNCYK